MTLPFFVLPDIDYALNLIGFLNENFVVLKEFVLSKEFVLLKEFVLSKEREKFTNMQVFNKTFDEMRSWDKIYRGNSVTTKTAYLRAQHLKTNKTVKL